ncbi:unnamed protein product [Brassica oleracea]
MRNTITADERGSTSPCSKEKRSRSQKHASNGILECSFCHALVWVKEKKGTRGPNRTPLFSICCQQDRVKLPPKTEAPPALESLLFTSTHFQHDIWTYNSIIAFTSMGAQIDHSVMHKTGPFTLKIHGQNAHMIGSLVLEPGQRPQFSQLYIVDMANEVENRISTVKRTAKAEKQRTYMKLIAAKISVIGQSKRNRQYDMPKADEIVGLIVGDFTQDMGERDVVVQHKSSGLQHITDMHPLFMTLQYPILFPYGQIGFNENISVTNTDGNTRRREYITKREYFVYQLQTRLAEGMVIARSKRRADLYNNVQDAVMKGDTDAKSIGKRVILPSSFTGSPRYMAEKYHDAIAICRWYGNPDLFITITTNPKRDEIYDDLKMYGSDDPNDCPDLEARVFKMKLDELISDFNKGIFFPLPKAFLYIIEFQKRGLPHAHILLWLEDLQLSPNELQQYTLIEIECLLQKFEKSLTEFTGMPLPSKSVMDKIKHKALGRNNQFDKAEETIIHEKLFDKLNHQQRALCDQAALRPSSKKTIPVASSAISVLLLPGGRTTHSRFSIPLKLYEDTYCKVKAGTILANFLSGSDLIIWDEAPMAHRHTFEAVDHTLRDILAVSDKTTLTKPFGGKIVLLGGYFRQISPVIPQGTILKHVIEVLR